MASPPRPGRWRDVLASRRFAKPPETIGRSCDDEATTVAFVGASRRDRINEGVLWISQAKSAKPVRLLARRLLCDGVEHVNADPAQAVCVA
jgi:hypothetical protein